MSNQTLDNDQHIQAFEAKLQLIRDRVSSVIHGYHTGAYLVGRPGTSKTYTVRQHLEQSCVPWVYQNARMTPMGLFSFIADHPEHVIVLDDIVNLFKNDQAMQLMMAGLDGTPGTARVVTYKSKDAEQRVLFTGAIIAISNVPLRCDPLARALGSRVVMLEHEPTDEEIAAYIWLLAAKGFDGLTTDECFQVSEFLISETRENDMRLDLRHFNKALRDFRQHKDGHAKTSWRDLVRTSLKRLATEPVVPTTKKEEKALHRDLVRKALLEFPNDAKAQIQASGLKSSTFYARRKEVLAEDKAA
jgi:hypothetical protein